MKYIIDNEICSKHGLTLAETLAILFLKECDGNYSDIFHNLLKKDRIVEAEEGDCFGHVNLYITQHWDDEVAAILLESDITVPKKDRCESLAEQLKELFPKGMKVGNSAWRGNKREITLRLQKFFKLYGNKWTDEEIIEATTRYIQSFNGDYTYMRILKYFIMKSEVKYDEEGNGHIEDVSELANLLENDTVVNNDNWLNEMR